MIYDDEHDEQRACNLRDLSKLKKNRNIQIY